MSEARDDGRVEVDAVDGGEEPAYEAITDGQTDIAMTLDGERMKVQALGRVPMQRIWLWTGSNEGTVKRTSSNVAYDKATDGPTDDSPSLLLPTIEELTPSPVAMQYLEVGLVIGNDPKKYLPVGESRNKARVKAREDRGVLSRDPSALRAFIPITEYIATQAKYYVGTHPTNGRCFPRVIDQGVVFYYEEFWHGLPDNSNKKTRRSFINNNIKRLAAIRKAPMVPSPAKIVSSPLADQTASNSLTVTVNENMTEGVKAFYCFEDEQFTGEDAEKARQELQWADRLPYNQLALFLDFCHYEIQANDDLNVKESMVDKVLHLIAMVEGREPTRTTSNAELVRNEKYRAVLGDVRDYIRAFVRFNRKAAQAPKECDDDKGRCKEEPGGFGRALSLPTAAKVMKFGVHKVSVHQKGRQHPETYRCECRCYLSETQMSKCLVQRTDPETRGSETQTIMAFIGRVSDTLPLDRSFTAPTMQVPGFADDTQIVTDTASNTEQTTFEAITDGQTDIAMTFDGERMTVAAVGRMHMQKVYLWTGSNEGQSRKTSNVAYDKSADAPGDNPPSRLPTVEELTPSPAAVQYLEVGIVIGDDPKRYLPTGESRDKARVKARQDRGVLARDPSAMRVFLSLTEYISSQAKYYVGTHPTNGRCFPRTIDQGFIFFYAEFWYGLPDHANKKAKRDHVNGTAKRYAAIHKTATGVIFFCAESWRRLAGGVDKKTKRDHVSHVTKRFAAVHKQQSSDQPRSRSQTKWRNRRPPTHSPSPRLSTFSLCLPSKLRSLCDVRPSVPPEHVESFRQCGHRSELWVFRSNSRSQSLP
nr:hypothetical protein CFP56_34789 [Quercus suber]